ncbi:unnamed protein product [Phytomonas sp. Hart1]|nr:unnamed protein product [Phytomonas sp. Hart1]|eukprot:CCW70399.1 unnamed protein product [Phytomonas sp. isolate Hart1]
MIRRKAFNLVKDYGGMLSPFLLVAGILIMVLLPTLASQRVTIHENAIGDVNPEFFISKRIASTALSEAPWSQRLVRSGRSPGTDRVVVYVNTAYSVSMRLSNILIEHLVFQKDLSCDVQFYFVNDSMKWPIPEGYIRAALVLNISSSHHKVCIDLYSKHGIRPNQDLPSIAILYSGAESLEVSLMCQSGRSLESSHHSPLMYFMKSLEESMLVDNHPQPWHPISTRGISIIALSSNPLQASSDADDVVEGISAGLLHHSSMLLRMIQSLGRMEERFNHASWGYLPVSPTHFVSFDLAQLVLFLFIGSMVSTGYRLHQLHRPFGEGISTPAMAPIAGLVYNAAGLPGVTLITLFFAERAGWKSGMGGWIAMNIIGLVLILGLQPSTGFLGGAAVALQLFFLHPLCFNLLGLVIGVGVSWGVFFYFTWYLGFPIWCTNSISSTFVSVFLYPNCVWVLSRLLRYLSSKDINNIVY